MKLKRFVSCEKISSSLKIMRNGKTDQTVRMVVNIRPRFDRFDTNRCIAVSFELIEQKLFTKIVNFITDRVLKISEKYVLSTT